MFVVTLKEVPWRVFLVSIFFMIWIIWNKTVIAYQSKWQWWLASFRLSPPTSNWLTGVLCTQVHVYIRVCARGCRCDNVSCCQGNMKWEERFSLKIDCRRLIPLNSHPSQEHQSIRFDCWPMKDFIDHSVTMCLIQRIIPYKTLFGMSTRGYCTAKAHIILCRSMQLVTLQ